MQVNVEREKFSFSFSFFFLLLTFHCYAWFAPFHRNILFRLLPLINMLCVLGIFFGCTHIVHTLTYRLHMDAPTLIHVSISIFKKYIFSNFSNKKGRCFLNKIPTFLIVFIPLSLQLFLCSHVAVCIMSVTSWNIHSISRLIACATRSKNLNFVVFPSTFLFTYARKSSYVNTILTDSPLKDFLSCSLIRLLRSS